MRYAGQHVNGHWRSNIRLVLPLLTPLTTHSTFYSQRKYTLVKTSPQTYYQERRKPQNSVSCNVLGILETIAFYSSTHPVRVCSRGMKLVGTYAKVTGDSVSPGSERRQQGDCTDNSHQAQNPPDINSCLLLKMSLALWWFCCLETQILHAVHICDFE